MTPVAIFDPFSGIAGDMTLGALVECGLDADWVRALPEALALEGTSARVHSVLRGGIACTKVVFEIPDQPHGRHLRQMLAVIEACRAPAEVRDRAGACFRSIAEVEAALHGTSVDKVHLHEVGAVDAVLDVVGSIWGMQLLGVARVFSRPVRTGEGSVMTAHGLLPVPAPATLRLLEGLSVTPGPPGSGELVTPTGAALLRAWNAGPEPESYVPLRSGFGAGTREFPDRPNALRLILAELRQSDSVAEPLGLLRERVLMLAADIDDMTPEELAFAADEARRAGALDVVVFPSIMKKGRPGYRLELLCTEAEEAKLTAAILRSCSTLGVRRLAVERHTMPRRSVETTVSGRGVRVKVATAGSVVRVKAEADDVQRVAGETGRSFRDVASDAERQARDSLAASVEVPKSY